MENEVITQLEGVKASMLEALTKQKADMINQYEELKASGAKTAEFAAEFKDHQRRLDEVEAILKRPAGTFGELAPVAKSLGQMLVESEDIKRFAKSWTRGAAALNIEGSIFPRSLKTLIDSTAVGSSIPGILVPERVGGIKIGRASCRERVLS